jgi:hypothetical protein
MEVLLQGLKIPRAALHAEKARNLALPTLETQVIHFKRTTQPSWSSNRAVNTGIKILFDGSGE